MKKIIYSIMFLICSLNLCFSQGNKEENLTKYGNLPAEQYSRKADELFAQDKKDLALEYANKAVKSDSNYAYAYYIRGTILMDGKNDCNSALKDLNKAITLKSTNPDPAYYLVRGEIKYKLNDYKGAISDYEETMKIQESRKDTEYNQNYAKSFSKRGIAKCGLGDKKGGCADIAKGKKLGDYDGDNNTQQYCK